MAVSGHGWLTLPDLIAPDLTSLLLLEAELVQHRDNTEVSCTTETAKCPKARALVSFITVGDGQTLHFGSLQGPRDRDGLKRK